MADGQIVNGVTPADTKAMINRFAVRQLGYCYRYTIMRMDGKIQWKGNQMLRGYPDSRGSNLNELSNLSEAYAHALLYFWKS